MSDFLQRGSTPEAQEDERRKSSTRIAPVWMCIRSPGRLCSPHGRQQGHDCSKTFMTATQELTALSNWLSAEGTTHIAMEATGIYWKPIWHIWSDGEFELILA